MAANQADFKATLTKTVEDFFNKNSKEKFSKDPAIETKPVTVVDKRMVISGFEKFAVRTYICVVYCYLSAGDLQKHKPYGAIVFYFKESGVTRLLEAFDYLKKGTVESAPIREGCGKLSDNIAESFKQSAVNSGYNNFEVAKAVVFRDSVPEGIDYRKNQKEYSEVHFFLWEENPFSIDLVLA